MAAPVAAVAARARSVGIPRGWLAALAALVALLLGATWVMVAAHIAGAVGRCLAAEGGPAWAEDKCRHLMTYPPAVAVVSLALTLVLCVREARAESKVRKAWDGARAYLYLSEVGIAMGPESRHLRESDAMALGVMIVIYVYCFLVMVLGLLVRNAASRRQLQDPADTGATTLAQSGSAITLAGCLASWFEYCCLVFPYMMIRLRRFVRANWAVTLPA